VTPVIIGATGTISKHSEKDLSNIPGKNGVEETQKEKTAIFVTAHILQKALMLKYETFNTGNNITCTKNCKYRTAATLYTLLMWFVSVCKYKIPA
jgi:hypothetical protein